MANAFENLKNKMTQQFEGYSKSSKEAWSQNLDYYNNTLNLIYGLLIGLLSSILIQASFSILTGVVKEEYLLFSYVLLAGVSAIVLTIVSWLLIKSIKQAKDSIKYHENIMKSSKKNLDNLKKEIKT